jgi:nuclear pore complex protein Nup188
MGKYNHYFDTESCGLVHLFGDQTARALSWHTGESITLPLIEELEQTLNLFHSIALDAQSTDAHPEVANVMRVFSPLALRLLQQLNYAISHPNHLASLFEPITADDRALQDQSSPSGDVMKRPLIVHLIHRLFQISTSIVSTLVCISKADVVLTGDQHDWPLQEALVVPVSLINLSVCVHH